MHMADTLISPAVGATLWAISAAAVGHSSRRIQRNLDPGLIPLMGVLGAFVFAAQMINFSIPGTGSSGHLGGGLLLAILLGPEAALITTASVLVVQALIFADGGLLALGCNIFNMGFLPAFVAYPLVYRPLTAGRSGPTRRAIATLLAAILALQLGAFAVVMETLVSGRTDLPFKTFLLAMQPIHLAIGFVEGAVTLALLSFLQRTRPEILEGVSDPRRSWRASALVGLMALVLGGWMTWYASKHPDGLEGAVQKVTGCMECHVVTGEFDYFMMLRTRDSESFNKLHAEYPDHLPLRVARLKYLDSLKSKARELRLLEVVAAAVPTPAWA